jgi:predicted signal transduction protein with EAL and GGDEF domain
VLIEIGARLRRAVREGDLVARLGGDEFAILAPDLSGLDAAASMAERMVALIDVPVRTRATDHPIAAAIGIALMPQHGDKSEALRKADIALYRAKGGSRSAVCFFEDEMDGQVRERDAIERELRTALDADLIRPYFQPHIDLRTGRVVGFEALARWHHPVLGDMRPDQFITVADDCGLIGQLTDQLLRRACAAALQWPDDVLLSFNISACQLRDPTLGLRLMAALAETGLSPSRLEIELAESALVFDLDHARTVLGALRETGVKIALDDFGTGYSSLYHLRAFKFDRIKIDRSFVEMMGSDPEAAAIVRALIGLGSGLNLNVTAEGVETAQQEAALRAQGCTQAQGFRFSRAVPAEETIAMVGGRADSPRSSLAG